MSVGSSAASLANFINLLINSLSAAFHISHTQIDPSSVIVSPGGMYVQYIVTANNDSQISPQTLVYQLQSLQANKTAASQSPFQHYMGEAFMLVKM